MSKPRLDDASNGCPVDAFHELPERVGPVSCGNSRDEAWLTQKVRVHRCMWRPVWRGDEFHSFQSRAASDRNFILTAHEWKQGADLFS